MILFALILIVCISYIYFHYYVIRITPPLSQNYVVLMRKKEFNKGKLTIQKNDSVSFINRDIVRHQILNDADSVKNSILLSPGDTFRITLIKPGSYIFYSGLYPDMNRCVVVVENALVTNDYDIENKATQFVRKTSNKVKGVFE